MRYCCAFGCINGTKTVENRKYVKENNITFHGFPFKDENRWKLWVDKVGRKGFQPTRYSSLCSEHFNDDDFKFQPFTNMRLVNDTAVPSRFGQIVQRPVSDGCCVLNCPNAKNKEDDEGISFYKFPTEERRCKRWVQKAGRQDLLEKTAKELSTEGYKLCSRHFESSQFNPSTGMSRRLVWNAIPTLFDLLKPKPAVTSKRKVKVSCDVKKRSRKQLLECERGCEKLKLSCTRDCTKKTQHVYVDNPEFNSREVRTRETSEKVDGQTLVVKQNFAEWCPEIKQENGEWCPEIKQEHGEWCPEIKQEHGEWCSEIKQEHGEWCPEIKQEHGEWCSEIKQEHDELCPEIKQEHCEWCPEIKQEHGEWCPEIKQEHGEWCPEIKQEHGEWCPEIKTEHGDS